MADGVCEGGGDWLEEDTIIEKEVLEPEMKGGREPRGGMNLGGEGEDIRGGKVFLGKRVLSSIDRKWRFLLGTQTDSESLVR